MEQKDDLKFECKARALWYGLISYIVLTQLCTGIQYQFYYYNLTSALFCSVATDLTIIIIVAIQV